MDWSSETIATLSGIVVIIGFLWTLHRDVSGLRERMARLEGKMEVLTGNVQTLTQVLIEQRKEGNS